MAKGRAPQIKAKDLGEISPKEKEAIRALREREEKKTKCAAEIDATLKKFNATIGINPNSPFGNPEITISLNR